MLTYCTRCNINWQRLWSQDDGDMDCEYCPKCKSDMFLAETKPGATYIMLADASIINWQTKEPLLTTPQKMPVIKRQKKQYDKNDWLREKEEARQDDDARINHYISVYQAQGADAAGEAWTNWKRQ